MFKVIDHKNIKLTSINNKYCNRSFKLSPEYRAFKEFIYYSIRKPVQEVQKPYFVIILVKTYIDIDNPIKATLDAMEDFGLIENDKKVLRLVVDKEEEKRGYPSDFQVYLGTKGKSRTITIPELN